jgi:hypothetical protein
MTTKAIMMMAILIAGIFAVLPALQQPQQTHAVTYYIRYVINFYDLDIFNCIDEIYVRSSDSKVVNGEHPILLNKATIEDPNQPQYVIRLPFDPKKLTQNSGLIRTYMLLEQNENVVYKDYKRPYTPFDPQRTQYTFTFNVRTDLGCGQLQSQLQSQSLAEGKQSPYSEPELRTLKVPRGDQNRQ